jgi:hypothetical protein
MPTLSRDKHNGHPLLVGLVDPGSELDAAFNSYKFGLVILRRWVVILLAHSQHCVCRPLEVWFLGGDEARRQMGGRLDVLVRARDVPHNIASYTDLGNTTILSRDFPCPKWLR